MSDKFNLKLIELLKKDLRFVDEDNDSLIRNEITNFALKADKELIGLLIKDEEVRNYFFDKIQEYYVFNINKFIEYVEDKNFLSNSYTKFKNQIGLNINGKYLRERGEISLVWPFKDCVLEGGMTKEDQKRNEIFFNETLAKDEIDRLFDTKALTNFKKFTVKGEEKVKDFNRDENGTIKDNLIIKGNNLLALHSLKKEFAEKVKLIYIDPPYNTGSDSFTYNDNFNHSTWLTFMKNRLEVAKELLKNDGVIFVQCDDNQQAYLKVLMDDIFHKNNFLSVIAYQRSGVAGLGQGGKFVVNVTEYINIFAKDFNLFHPYLLESGVPLDLKHMKRYNGILVDDGSKEQCAEFISKSTGKSVKIFKHNNYKIEKISLANFKENKKEILEIYRKNFNNIFRLNVPQKENSFQHKIISCFEDDALYTVEYLVNRGKHKGEVITNYYYKNQLFAWLKSSGKIMDGELVKTNKLSDFWTNAEIPKADLANEGGVTLSRGKKPEQLLKRILEIGTVKKDIVLDYHLGSGTTCAVAHKMGRQYIGVEQLDYGKNDSVVRLKNVIGKEILKDKLLSTIEDYDVLGISKAVNWKGGGEFIYCELKKYNEEALDKIQDAKDTKSLLKIWNEMVEHYFLNYDVEIHKFNKNKVDFEKLSLTEQKKLLCEMLNKNQLYVNLSEIDDKQFNISKEDKELNSKFYGGN